MSASWRPPALNAAQSRIVAYARVEAAVLLVAGAGLLAYGLGSAETTASLAEAGLGAIVATAALAPLCYASGFARGVREDRRDPPR